MKKFLRFLRDNNLVAVLTSVLAVGVGNGLQNAGVDENLANDIGSAVSEKVEREIEEAAH